MSNVNVIWSPHARARAAERGPSSLETLHECIRAVFAARAAVAAALEKAYHEGRQPYTEIEEIVVRRLPESPRAVE
jgi:hypothetical protein